MSSFSYTKYQREIQTIIDFYNFLHIPGVKLEELVINKHEFNHFYAEYVGKLTGLNAEKVILFNSKASYRQTAIVFHAIYNKSEFSENEYSLAMAYLPELVTLRAITLFFYNWTWEDVKAMMGDCPELQPPINQVMKKNQENNNLVAMGDVEFFEIFLNTSSEGKAAIMHYALKRYKEEAERGIKHGLEFHRKIQIQLTKTK